MSENTENNTPVEGQAPEANTPDLTPDVVNTYLSKATEGKFSNIDDIGGLLETRDKYSALQEQYKNLEAQTQVKPWANELVEKVNNMFLEGADKAKILDYAQLHFQDFDQMSPEDLVRKSLSMKGYDSDQVGYLIDRDFPMPNPDDFEDDEAGYKRALRQRDLAVSVASKEAREHINSLLADTGDNGREEQRQQDEQRRERLQSGWSKVVTSLSKSDGTLGFSIPEGDKALGGGSYSFDYVPPEDRNQEIIDAVTNRAVQAGLDITEENLPQIREMYQTLLWNVHREDYLRHMTYNMYAELSKHFAEQYSQRKPVRSAPEAPVAPKVKKDRFPKSDRRSNLI